MCTRGRATALHCLSHAVVSTVDSSPLFVSLNIKLPAIHPSIHPHLAIPDWARLPSLALANNMQSWCQIAARSLCPYPFIMTSLYSCRYPSVNRAKVRFFPPLSALLMCLFEVFFSFDVDDRIQWPFPPTRYMMGCHCLP